MATIRARKQADGTTRYTAIVRLRRGKALLHQECKTFALRTAAASWAKHREVELENQAIPGRKRHGPVTLAELIRWYIVTFEPISKWQRSKQAHLRFLERHALGKLNALELTAAALINHVRARRADGVGPATAMNDLIGIGVVMRAAKSVREIPVRPEIAQEGRSACGELRLIGKPRKRSRRPTPDELACLRQHFDSRDRRARIPMRAVIDFAIASARSEAEICRLEWQDNDVVTRTGIVRDAKHPTARESNHRRFRYTPEAWAAAQAEIRAFVLSCRAFGYGIESAMLNEIARRCGIGEHRRVLKGLYRATAQNHPCRNMYADHGLLPADDGFVWSGETAIPTVPWLDVQCA